MGNVHTFQSTLFNSTTATNDDRSQGSIVRPIDFTQFFVIEPQKELLFTLIPSVASVAILTLRNTSPFHYILFGVKTKSIFIHRYMAHPNHGVIGPGKLANLVVILKQGFCRAFAAMTPEERQSENHHILLQVVEIGENVAEMLKLEGKDQIESTLAAHWKGIDVKTEKILIKRIACRFLELKYNSHMNL